MNEGAYVGQKNTLDGRDETKEVGLGRDKGSWVGQENTLDGRDETKEAGLGRRTH